MTTEAKKTLRATAGVLVCIVAIGAGAIWRDKTELGHVSIATDSGTPRVVQANYKGTELPETQFFDDIMLLLKRKYVEPITDETKLADGSVRGMVASLGDPNSLYMDNDQRRVYDNLRKGKYEGVGADLVLVRDKPQAKVQTAGDDEADDPTARLPKLMVAAVVPGSSADKAGLKPGDWAEFVEGRWIPNSEAFDMFTQLGEKVKHNKASQEDYFKMRKLLRQEADKRMLPIRARDRLMMGTSGTVVTQWVRGDKRIKLTLTRGEWQMPGFGAQADGSIRLPFVEGVAQKLRDAIVDKAEVTIDLRNNVQGDYDAMTECLKEVAPNGTYGYFTTQKNDNPTPLTIANGNEKHPRLNLLVDRTTRGIAEIFALALSSRGTAKLVGSEMAGSPYLVREYPLPSGAAFTLVTGEYRANAPVGVVAKRAGANRPEVSR